MILGLLVCSTAARALEVAAWSRATAPGTTVGVVYFDVTNSGAADLLLAVESPAAQRAEMHSTTADGMMRMRPMESVAVPAKGQLVFKPGGMHVMLLDLVQPLRAGMRIPITLLFRDAGRISAEALVRGNGQSEPAANPEMQPAASARPDFRLTVWPMHAETPQFALIDGDGRARTLADYRDHVVVLLFGFVHCPDACPAELFKLSLVLKQLGGPGERVRVLFVTLDPTRDRGAVLKHYVSAFNPAFVALRGSSVQIDRAANSFHVEYARVGQANDYTIDHSTTSFVFDRAGRLRLLGTLQTSIADYTHDLAALSTD